MATTTLFEKQTLLRIRLNTGIDLTGNNGVKIIYRKPDGTVGEWSAVLDPGDPEDKNIYYDVQSGDIDQVGTWNFQSYVLVGTLEGYGQIISERFEHILE